MTNRLNGYRAKSADLSPVAWVIVGLALAAFIAVCLILAGLVTLLAWNFGVVAIVAACGGAVAKIGLGTAICVNLAIGVIGRIFRRQEVKTNS